MIALVFVVCVPNIIGLFMLAPIVKAEVKDFVARLKANQIKDYRATEKK